MPSVRKLAIDALRDIWFKGLKPKDALEGLAESLDKRDRAFLMELVYGVLRYKDALDWILKDSLEKPQKLPFDTINNLRAGVYQIFYMRVPEWAAVNEAVDLEKGGRRPLVNAVLRNILRNKEKIDEALKTMEEASLYASTDSSLRLSYISTLTSHPKWLIRRWLKRFGHEEAFELAKANNRVPPLTLRVNMLKAERADMLKKLKELGIEAEPTFYSPQGIKLKTPHTFRELTELRGCLTPQDEAAQLISYLLEPEPGHRVLDAGAAPGGKTTHMAELMADKGQIIALDIDGKRILRLNENISRLGLKSISVLKADINNPGEIGEFDRILLDAPCTALGVIRRNPDAKYRHKEADLRDFKKRQLQMLYSVSVFLKPGGMLVYSTCSTEPEEGEDVVGEFLKTEKNFYIIKSDANFIKYFYEDGFIRTYAHRHDMDGFFGVRICKKT